MGDIQEVTDWSQKSVPDRLMYFLKCKNLGKQEFLRSVGLSNSYIQNIVKGLGNKGRRNIMEVYPELNIDWVETGFGEMLLDWAPSRKDDSDVFRVPLLPLSMSFEDVEQFLQEESGSAEMVISPVRNASFAMNVVNESMAPDYRPGEIVIVKKIDPSSFIDWGSVYVMDTCNGIVMRKLMPSIDDEKLRCVASNGEYPYFDIKVEDVRGFYKVLIKLCPQ